MSEQNTSSKFSKPKPAKDTKKQSNPAKSRNRFLLITGSVLLIALVAFLVNQNLRQKDDLGDLTIKMDELSAEITGLENNIQGLESELNQENARNTDLEEELRDREELLNEYKSKVEALQASKKISDQQAAQLKSRVASLEYYLRTYEEKVEKLTEELALEKEKSAALEADVADLEDKNFDLSQKNTYNETMLDAGAILKAADFRFARVKNNGKEDYDMPFRSGRLDRLRIKFNIRENIFTKTGKKTLYISIYGPNGKAIQHMGGGSGYFTYDDRDTPYTLKKEINFKRDELPVSVDFVRPESLDYEDGQHVVKIYAEGFHIGSGTFKVK